MSEKEKVDFLKEGSFLECMRIVKQSGKPGLAIQTMIWLDEQVLARDKAIIKKSCKGFYHYCRGNDRRSMDENIELVLDDYENKEEEFEEKRGKE